jgi:hypothetical protein
MRPLLLALAALAFSAGPAAAINPCTALGPLQLCYVAAGTYEEQSLTLDQPGVARAVAAHQSIDGFAGHSEGLQVAAATAADSPAGANGAALTYYCLDFNGPGSECDILALDARAFRGADTVQGATYNRDLIDPGTLCLDGAVAQCAPLVLPFL